MARDHRETTLVAGNQSCSLRSMSENHPMAGHPFRKKAYESDRGCDSLSRLTLGRITVEPEVVSYLPGPIGLHDCAEGVMAAVGSVPEPWTVRVSSQRVPPRRPSTRPIRP